MSRKELPPANFLDFSGGLNEAPPTKLAPNQLSRLENWFPYGRWLQRRGGVEYQSLEPAAQPLNTVYNYVDVQENRPGELSFGREYLIGGGTDTIYRYDGPGWSTPDQPPSIPYDLFTWTFRQYRNALYSCRLGSGLRWSRPPFDQVHLAGIQPPQTCDFTLTEQDDGELREGYYEYVLTYRNSITNTESGRSCPKRIKTTADDKWILIQSIDQPPSSSTADEIRIYRSLRVDPAATVDPDIPFGEYFYVATVPIGVNRYEDRKAQIDLGFVLGEDTVSPPGDMYLFEVWQERAWLSNGQGLIWSEVGQLEMYDIDNYVAIEPGQGQFLTVLLAWGDRLIAAKRGRIFTITQTGPNSWNRDTLSDTHGIPSPNAARVHEGTLFFFGGDNFYRSDGGPPYAISTTEIRDTLDAIPPEQNLYVSTCVYPKRSWFLASVPQKDGERVILCHNYKDGGWTKFRHWDGVTWIDMLERAQLQRQPWCLTQDGHAYRYDQGLVDRPGRPNSSVPYEEEPIVCRLRTGAFAVGADVRMWMRRFRLMCNRVAASVRATLYADEKPVAVKERLVPLHRGQLGGRGIDRRWRLFNFNSELLGYAHQLEIEYSGRDPINLEGVGVDTTQREDFEQQAQ